MKKVISLLSLILAMFFLVSCVDEGDIESALAGSPCETSDTFKCDGDILLKCEDYVWEKFKLCTGKRCDAAKGTCEAADENSGGNDADSGDSGYNPGGNQNDPTDPGYNQDPTSDPTANPTDPGYTDPTNDPTDPTTDPTNPGYPDPTGDPTNDPQPGCTGLSVNWSSLTTDSDDPGVYYYTSGNPYVSFEFVYPDDSTVKKGTYDLGSSINSNYKTCTECVRIIRDHEDFFFQTSGTLKIDSVDSSNNIKGSISAKFAEVYIDADTYESTPVPGGECFEIQSGYFDNTTGGGDTPATGCTGLSIDWSSFTYYEDDYIEGYFADVEFGSSSKSDDFQMQFFQNSNGKISTGTYDLGSGKNANYKTCTECVLAYQDYNESTDEYAKLFFQKSGTLKLTKATTSGAALAGTISATLIEVTIDPDNEYTSTPVSGGACLEIEAGSFNYSGN